MNIENTENIENVENNNTENSNVENSNVENTENQDLISNYPDGFDAETYDLTSKTFKADGIKAKFDKSNKDIESLKKQNLDLRRIISKGKEVVNVEDYELSYKPDSRFNNVYENQETQEAIKGFNEVAKDIGLNIEQHKQVLDYFNNTLEKMGIFDTRSEKEKDIQMQDWLKAEKKKLGENADYIINKSTEFVNNHGLFNEKEKEKLLALGNSGAIGVSILNKMRIAIMGENISTIPADVKSDGLADDYSLAKEYYDANTTDQRRSEIIVARIEAGRKGKLPVL